LLVLVSTFVAAQSPVADSLRQAISGTANPQQKIDLQNELVMELYDWDWGEAYATARSAYRLSQQTNYRAGEKRALTLLGVGFYLRAEVDTAVYYFNASNQMREELDPASHAYNWIMWAAANRIQSRFSASDSLLRLAVRSLERQNNQYFLAVAYRNFGELKRDLFQLGDAELFYQRALSVWILLDNAEGKRSVQWDLAELEIGRSRFEAARQYLAQACQPEPVRNNFYQCYYLEAKLEMENGRFREAVDLLSKAIGTLQGSEQKLGSALIRFAIGDAYSLLDQYDLALRNYLIALRALEEIGASADRARVLSEIAWVYKAQFNFPLAKDYLNQSLAIRQRINDQAGISNCYNIFGLIALQEQKYSESIDLLNRAYQIRETLGYRKGMLDVLYNLSLVYSQLREYQQAADYLNRSLAIARQLETTYDIAYSYNSLGAIQTQTGDFDEAEKNLNLALAIILKSGSKTLLKANYSNMGKLMEARGNHREAVKYLRREVMLMDSMYQTASVTKMAEMQAVYGLEQKDQQIKLLALEKSLQDEELSRQRWFVVFLTFGILLIAVSTVVLYLFYRQRTQSNAELLRLNRSISEQKEEIQTQTEELLEANQTIANINLDLESRIEQRTRELTQAYKELDTFFYRSSHDFRRPITTFLGLAEVAKVTVSDPGALQLFQKVSETAHNLDRMLVKLQSISELTVEDQLPLPIGIKKLLDDLIFTRQNEILAKEIKVMSEVIGPETVVTQTAWLRLIIDNLLENAIQFATPLEPCIKIMVINEPFQFNLYMEDNGEGIAPENQARIFEMYFRGSVRSKGSGLGLYVVRKVVERLRGTIQITSQAGANSGTKVQVSFPVASALSR
jgi:signal transduction histidine kinase